MHKKIIYDQLNDGVAPLGCTKIGDFDDISSWYPGPIDRDKIPFLYTYGTKMYVFYSDYSQYLII